MNQEILKPDLNQERIELARFIFFWSKKWHDRMSIGLESPRKLWALAEKERKEGLSQIKARFAANSGPQSQGGPITTVSSQAGSAAVSHPSGTLQQQQFPLGRFGVPRTQQRPETPPAPEYEMTDA